MNYLRNLSLVTVVLPALVLVGCGGGGGSSSATPAEPVATDPVTAEAVTYQLSILAIEASDRGTHQSIAVEGLPIAGSTATVQ